MAGKMMGAAFVGSIIGTGVAVAVGDIVGAMPGLFGSLGEKGLYIDMAKAKFNARLIEREVYAPNQFEELKEFSDDERLLALSEGREKNMQWLVMTRRRRRLRSKSICRAPSATTKS